MGHSVVVVGGGVIWGGDASFLLLARALGGFFRVGWVITTTSQPKVFALCRE